MDKWRDGVGRSPPRRRRDYYPSFSSTLLDAIYRSFDEMDERGDAPEVVRKKQSNVSGENRERPTMKQPQVIRPRSRATATSSSSDGSSYGSFSSSDAESVSVTRLRPIRTTAAVNLETTQARSERCRLVSVPNRPPLPPISLGGDEKCAKKNRHGSFRNRLRDFGKGRTPASPGARLTNFLNSLFAAKSKVSAEAVAKEESSCSTASSYSRSCLSKTLSFKGRPETGKRTVSFGPVSVMHGTDQRPAPVGMARAEFRLPVRSAVGMLRRSEVEEDEESDSSSDLFELENLAVIGRFRDELPVYETTRLGNYGVISRGLLL
ncbi:hypothetical protein HPP92_007989 [Vanilla planifolia]|uniref:Protein BIG GRAIN 1-like B n=1 Tax=Vanilla planifolia TaxID=51239 RepID=A0A835REW9_VANPL|nr:hypothetical protein HPP92_007989 [Vanilla planifolia]